MVAPKWKGRCAERLAPNPVPTLNPRGRGWDNAGTTRPAGAAARVGVRVLAGSHRLLAVRAHLLKWPGKYPPAATYLKPDRRVSIGSPDVTT